MKHSSTQRGFTLLEVVVAFSIMALAMAALAESFHLSTQRASRAVNLASADLLAASLRERLGVDIPLDRRHFSDAQGSCGWQIESVPSQSALLTQTRLLQGFDVAVDVSCGAGSSARTSHLEVFELAVTGS
jgi:prepilin-type N-terminal cleavage/methylation domain-containing protein